MDVRLIEIDEVMALIARTVEQRADLSNEGLSLLWIRPRSGLMPCQAVSRLGATEQLMGLLPRQPEPVQRAADGLAAEAAAKLLLHKADQAPQRPARLYIGTGEGRTGRLVLRGANLLAQRGGNIWAKGGRPPVR